MSVRALLRAILLAVLVAATCQADETTSDYSAADSTDRPDSTEDEETNKSAASNQGLKPTKYHYYPHNQHIYLLPECAVQQVCNAVYVRLNYTQPLCACPSRYKEPCSASLNADDLHTTELSTDPTGKILTLVKTCEPVAEMRTCRSPRDWSLLALQNVRTGKSHYLVICRCPHTNLLRRVVFLHRGPDESRPADVRQRPRHQSVWHDVRDEERWRRRSPDHVGAITPFQPGADNQATGKAPEDPPIVERLLQEVFGKPIVATIPLAQSHAVYQIRASRRVAEK